MSVDDAIQEFILDSQICLDVSESFVIEIFRAGAKWQKSESQKTITELSSITADVHVLQDRLRTAEAERDSIREDYAHLELECDVLKSEISRLDDELYAAHDANESNQNLVANLISERDSLKADLQKSRSQEPVASRRKDFMGNWVYRNQDIAGNEPLYAAPVPAQQVPDAIALLQRVASKTSGDASEELKVKQVQAPSDNQAKAALIMDFVGIMIGAFDSGFVDTARLNLAQLYQVARNHVKDNFGIETKSLADEMGEDFARCCNPKLRSAVPDGYRLVPVEPTDEMLNAAWEVDIECHNCESQPSTMPLGDFKAKECYQAMLSAAPEVK